MTINWFTVVAQILNFLVLVWLMKRFLYKPVLAAIQEREQKIQSQLKDAELKKGEAMKQEEEFRLKNETFDKEKKALMDNVLKEVKTEKNKLEEESRNEISNQKTIQLNALKEDKLKSVQSIKRKTQDEVFAVTRKTLSDLASISLEDQMINQFLQKFQSDEQLMKNLKSSSEHVIVQSAFNLSSEQQDRIKTTFQKKMGEQTVLQFNTAPKIISGIEVSVSGYKLSWNIADYLDTMEKSNSATQSETITA